MADPYVSEIKIFAGNFAIKGWAFCNGQSIPIRQNTTLFSLLGYNFGGDSQNFNLPNMQGRAPVSYGQGTGLSNYNFAQSGGTPSVTLTSQQIPAHNHGAQAFARQSLSTSPQAGNAVGRVSNSTDNLYATTGNADTAFSGQVLQQAGNSSPHNNLQPFLGLNFLIALQGIYPDYP